MRLRAAGLQVLHFPGPARQRGEYLHADEVHEAARAIWKRDEQRRARPRHVEPEQPIQGGGRHGAKALDADRLGREAGLAKIGQVLRIEPAGIVDRGEQELEIRAHG